MSNLTGGAYHPPGQTPHSNARGDNAVERSQRPQEPVSEPRVYLEDTDFTLYVGDVREVLRELPDGCVDCVVTSPPYWGLRDYGTGVWVGGNPDCDHLDTAFSATPRRDSPGGFHNSEGRGNQPSTVAPVRQFGKTCGKCGATRQDQQLGLEPTPDQYVHNMVAVFREVRRVLADHGTCWVNLGDSYSGSWSGHSMRPEGGSQRPGGPGFQPLDDRVPARVPNVPGLKPKDLVGIPWRIAFALQADGWYLRSDIIWSKPNPMPESVTDRPTKAHEYVFLLSKKPRYWFDAEAVRERLTSPIHAPVNLPGDRNGGQEFDAEDRLREWGNPAGRNVRSVWDIPTQPYPEAHFATYPEELVRRCLLAGCPSEVCRVCGKPRERIVDDTKYEPPVVEPGVRFVDESRGDKTRKLSGADYNAQVRRETVGWSDCGHGSYRPGKVLDPFLGSGTTATVARKHGRHTIGIELNPTYAELAAKRTRQLSLLT